MSQPAQPPRWPPRLIFNMDGNWAFNYEERRSVEDVARPLEFLADAGVDAFSVLVGIDDDLSWRGSPHGQLWGDNVEDWDPDGDTSRRAVGGTGMAAMELIHNNLAAIVEDGHDLMRIYVDSARRSGRSIFAGFRMNDAHVNLEDRGWYGRSSLKLSRPDLLIGSPAPLHSPGIQYNFCWQWDYAQPEVRERFLGLFEETLARYEFDGLELDFCRGPYFFKPGQAVKNIPLMTEFIRQAQETVRRHGDKVGRPLKLLVRVPPSIDGTLTTGIDTEAWLREGLVDIAVLGSPGYCTQEIDVGRAIDAAKEAGVLVYTGFDSETYQASPQGGHDRNPTSVLRAAALNGYLQGATGVHVFNYDYNSHRPGPIREEDVVEIVSATPAGAGGRYTAHDVQTLRDLADPSRLKRLDRCYYLEGEESVFDHIPQVPRRLALVGRGAGPEHALRFTVEDDIAGGLAEGRIVGTELRLRFTDHEGSFDRIRCQVNGDSVDLKSARKVTNLEGLEWLIVDNPPVKQGLNTVLVALEGTSTPEPWPTLHNCELLVLCER